MRPYTPAWLVLCLLALPLSVRAEQLPAQLTDIRGQQIDVAASARSSKLFIVTVKATSCPVCRAQLERLKQQLPRLRSCEASFIVISPGPREEIAKLANETGFPFPFVEDRGLALATKLGLRLSATELTPAILGIDQDRQVAWQQRGRSGLYFGDPELLKYLDCPALQVAQAGFESKER